MNIYNNDNKNMILTENIKMCTYNEFKMVPIAPTIKYKYDELYDGYNNYETICIVDVVYADIINVAEKFINMNPVLVYGIDDTFNKPKLYDIRHVSNHDFILRSNYYKTINPDHFPLKYGEITYAKRIFVFRNDKYDIAEHKFGIATITYPTLIRPKLLLNNLKTNDYILFQQSIETVFQCASICKHDVLLLSDMGSISLGIPIDDIIEILNICILKYCGIFKFIIIGIANENHHKIMNSKIIKPHSL